MSSKQFLRGYARLWEKKWKGCQLRKWQSKLMIFSIVRGAQSRNLWVKATKSTPSHPPPRPQLSRRRQPHHQPSQLPSATRKKLTSISSTEVVAEASAEAVATAERQEAVADLTSTDSKAPRRQETIPTTTLHHLPPRLCLLTPVVGTVVLETKLGSVTQNAPSTIPSTQLKSRETAKGADVCERGHPLLLIKRSQRSPICS